MKITTQKCQPRQELLLEDAPNGTVVRFSKTFSDRHNVDDLFIVNAVCNSYVPETVKRSCSYPHNYDKYERGTVNDQKNKLKAYDFSPFGKIGLTNLRNGSLSYVSGQRPCIAVETEVLNHGDTE